MGLRFRKSVKLAKGVRINLGKSGASLSVGNRGGGITFGKKTRVRASIPGTGLSYSTNLGKSKSKKKHKSVAKNSVSFTSPQQLPKMPFFAQTWLIIVSGIVLLSGVCSVAVDLLAAIICILIGGAIFVFGLYTRFSSPEAINYKKIKKALADPQVQRQIRIFDDSLKLIMESKEPATFFGRYSDAYNAAEAIRRITDAPCVHGGTASEVIEALNNDKVSVTNAFLDRYSEAIRLKAFSLTRGRKQKVESFKLITSEYENQMPQESIVYRDELYASMLAKLESI